MALARQGCSVRMLGEFSLRGWWSRRVALARQGCSVRMLGEFSLRGGGGWSGVRPLQDRAAV